MSFLLRATLVIGVLTYFAATREDGDRPAVRLPPAAGGGLGASLAAGLAGGLTGGLAGGLADTWAALPPELRERAAREGAAELSRRLAAIPASRDTLAEADRLPAWRGAPMR